jgi:hypothetical protein
MATKKKHRKNLAAVALGGRGGLSSRKNLTAEESSELGRRAVAARWAKAAAAKKDGAASAAEALQKIPKRHIRTPIPLDEGGRS